MATQGNHCKPQDCQSGIIIRQWIGFVLNASSLQPAGLDQDPTLAFAPPKQMLGNRAILGITLAVEFVMHRMSVTQKGQLVIPKELREKHGIRPNSEVIVTEIDGHIAILPAIDPLRQGRGMLRFDLPTTDLLRDARSAEFEKDRQLGGEDSSKKGRNVTKHR